MTLDWGSIASDVVAGVILATILGGAGFVLIFAKWLAGWMVRRASNRLTEAGRERRLEEWSAEVYFSSRHRALQFGISLWLKAGTVARAEWECVSFPFGQSGTFRTIVIEEDDPQAFKRFKQDLQRDGLIDESLHFVLRATTDTLPVDESIDDGSEVRRRREELRRLGIHVVTRAHIRAWRGRDQLQ